MGGCFQCKAYKTGVVYCAREDLRMEKRTLRNFIGFFVPPRKGDFQNIARVFNKITDTLVVIFSQRM